MKRPAILIITALSVAAVFVGLFTTSATVNAQATSTSSGQALEIGPPVINLSADPGTKVTTTISLRDVSPTSLLVTGEVNDFVASGEDGTPKIILDDSVSPYSLKQWVSPLPVLTLKPKEIKTLTITINVPADASPGGYYGVIRFTGTPPDLEGAGVSLSASLGSLVLLTVNGEAKEGLEIEEFSVSHDSKTGTLFEAIPLNFIQRLKNTGNIHEEPTGLVTVKDMFGNTVATLPINQPARDILPQSIRKFEVPLDSTVIGNKILFGLYTADLTVTYGTDKQTLTSSITFWVIPYTLIGIIVIALIGGFIALRILIKRYNRHIISKAKNQRHK